MKTRRKFSPEFNANVSLEASKEMESITELAKRFELHPNHVNTCKKEFLANSTKVCSGSSSFDKDSCYIKLEKLYETFG